MSLRWKIALAMALMVSVSTIIVGAIGYQSTKGRLYAEVDRSLFDIDGRLDRGFGVDSALPDRGPLAGLVAQVILRDGTVAQSTFPEVVSPTEHDLSVIGTNRRSVFSTVETAVGHYRVRTIGHPAGAIQVGRSLDETDRLLRSLRARTLLLVVLVAGLAIAAGLWIAGRVTASLRRLTGAAEHVETTGRLDVAGLGIGDVGLGADAAGRDEVGRLSVAFDRMLGALARSQEQQHRLVQDAGHELRTPLTSLRTNVETLRRFENLGADDRRQILEDLSAETEELTELVNEVVAVASGEAAQEIAESFDLAQIVREVVARYERRTGRPIEIETSPSLVVAQRSSVQRAVSCLLDNARKFDAGDGAIEVSVADATVTVSDNGIGIDEADLTRVFDRFYRSDQARTMPGSGLGLSIVREVAEHHGGTAWAMNRPDRGTTVGFRLKPDQG